MICSPGSESFLHGSTDATVKRADQPQGRTPYHTFLAAGTIFGVERRHHPDIQNIDIFPVDDFLVSCFVVDSETKCCSVGCTHLLDQVDVELITIQCWFTKCVQT